MSSEPPITKPFDFAEDAAPAQSIGEHGNSYSLRLLFYITTIAAILTAVCRLAFVQSTWSAKAIVVGYVITGTLCVLMSMVLGYLIGRNRLSILLGLLAGLICGMVALLMSLVQPSHYEVASMLLCAGCWILAVISIASNR